MTRLSPPTLYRCSTCAGYFTHSILTFLHFYDDVPEWSDGKNEQPWIGLSGPTGRCPTCRAVVWVEDCTALMREHWAPRSISRLSRIWYLLTGDRDDKLGQAKKWNLLPREIREAERFDILGSAQDFVDALAQTIPLLPDREKYLRMQLWWISNDHLRREGEKAGLEANTARANMERLLALIPNTEWSLERIELYRQLGRFQEALDLIHASPLDQWAKTRLQQQWAAAGDSTMRVIPPQTTDRARRSQRGAIVW